MRALSADTLFGADLTIMEEGTELLHRLKAHLEQVGWTAPPQLDSTAALAQRTAAP
jgi:hypothetical protein